MADTRPEIRPDLLASHEALLEALRRPGCWLSGAERLAVAAASRRAERCALCQGRRDALSPEHAEGLHERGPDEAGLSDALIEVAHRVRTGSGRLSRAWYERQLEGGLSNGAYVEAVGVVALLAGLDAFCRALGDELHALPEPLPGEPSHHTPSGLRDDVAWVPLLTPETARGPEAGLFPRGFVPNIMRALSSVPDHVRSLMSFMRSHYLSGEQMADPKAARQIDRLQMELVAARVSALNECFY